MNNYDIHCAVTDIIEQNIIFMRDEAEGIFEYLDENLTDFFDMLNINMECVYLISNAGLESFHQESINWICIEILVLGKLKKMDVFDFIDEYITEANIRQFTIDKIINDTK